MNDLLCEVDRIATCTPRPGAGEIVLDRQVEKKKSPHIFIRLWTIIIFFIIFKG